MEGKPPIVLLKVVISSILESPQKGCRTSFTPLKRNQRLLGPATHSLLNHFVTE